VEWSGSSYRSVGFFQSRSHWCFLVVKMSNMPKDGSCPDSQVLLSHNGEILAITRFLNSSGHLIVRNGAIGFGVVLIGKRQYCRSRRF
jgi:hypothetical protein